MPALALGLGRMPSWAFPYILFYISLCGLKMIQKDQEDAEPRRGEKKAIAT